MRVHRAMLALTLLCCASASILAQDKRAMTVDDLLELVRIGDVAMTPDGSRVFYSERHLDWETNKYEKTFFMISSEGGSPVPFVRKDGGENFLISPDGKYLSMLRKVEEKTTDIHHAPGWWRGSALDGAPWRNHRLQMDR